MTERRSVGGAASKPQSFIDRDVQRRIESGWLRSENSAGIAAFREEVIQESKRIAARGWCCRTRCYGCPWEGNGPLHPDRAREEATWKEDAETTKWLLLGFLVLWLGGSALYIAIMAISEFLG